MSCEIEKCIHIAIYCFKIQLGIIHTHGFVCSNICLTYDRSFQLNFVGKILSLRLHQTWFY